MYESQFAFSGTPFSLNPDPSFYFQSKGHGNALSYLRFGVYQGEGFVVVTGEIGAGKTTLVRTLLGELDAAHIVAAQIVSTQLEAGDLLRSVALAFGLAPKDLSKAELIASIEAFLTLLVTQNKRALLVVDEAQNLSLQAIEELRMLSNFQLGSHALLQSFLVGQPELRQLLTSKPMEQFRQRVIASCHLGPMDAAETRAYIEHRLRKVGWAGRPNFDDAAFDRIHLHSGGIPRRVNLLCNRLLLASYLSAEDQIDLVMVDKVAGEAHAEVGGLRQPVTLPVIVPVSASMDAPRVSARGRSSNAAGPILCVAGDAAGELRLSMLIREMLELEGAPPPILVRAGVQQSFAGNDALLSELVGDVPTVELEPGGGTVCGALSDALLRFETIIKDHLPSAVVLAGASDAMLGVGLAAFKCDVPAARVGAAGLLVRAEGVGRNDVVLECIAPALEAAQTPDGATAGTPADFVPFDPLGSAALFARGLAGAGDSVLARLQLDPSLAEGPRGYGVVCIGPEGIGRVELTRLIGALQAVSRELPLLWIAQSALLSKLDTFGLRRLLRGSSVVLLSPLDYLDRVALMAEARCLFTDSVDATVEAAALGVPRIDLGGASAGREPAEMAELLLAELRLRGGQAFAGATASALTAAACAAERTRARGCAQGMLRQLIGMDDAESPSGARRATA
ncbi:XrtA/PEP-CTERM system-associated ATPase [Variovorax sp. YR752]|uniref:XrtA/PEP-CTERM system-associated ATPase n=1 Tax=Variovorax sp. YR752 TaxID=1884383 RepID=UPI0031383980